MIKKILKYFLKGLLILTPLAVIFYIIIGIDSFLKSFFPFFSTTYTSFIAIAIIMSVGFIFSSKFTKDINTRVKNILKKFPHIYHTYLSIQRVVASFAGKDNVFDNPVWIVAEDQSRQIGFVTRSSMDKFGLNNYVAVYIPNSFSLSGDTIIIPKNKIIPITVNKKNAITLALSGGMGGKE